MLRAEALNLGLEGWKSLPGGEFSPPALGIGALGVSPWGGGSTVERKIKWPWVGRWV